MEDCISIQARLDASLERARELEAEVASLQARLDRVRELVELILAPNKASGPSHE